MSQDSYANPAILAPEAKPFTPSLHSLPVYSSGNTCSRWQRSHMTELLKTQVRDSKSQAPPLPSVFAHTSLPPYHHFYSLLNRCPGSIRLSWNLGNWRNNSWTKRPQWLPALPHWALLPLNSELFRNTWWTSGALECITQFSQLSEGTRGDDPGSGIAQFAE